MSRVERFSGMMREEISRIVREEVADPRIGFISVTQVDLSPDLRNARVYISVFGNEKQKKEAMAGLNSAAGFIRGKLAHMLETRVIPEIHFIQDDSIERGSRVLGIISKLGNEKKSAGKNKKRAKKR